MKSRQKVLRRTQIKSSEGEFLYELENSYELSPKLSLLILSSAKSCLLREGILREGQIEVRVLALEERAGKVLESLAKKAVVLTIDNGIEDIEVLKEYGRLSLRRIRLQRICQEAIEQQGVLTQEDAAKYLGCTVRTVQRDIASIKRSGIVVVTRGYLHNIGRGQTHKVKIVGMLLEGHTYSEIRLRTKHSIGSIKRYIESFVKVVMAKTKGIHQEGQISAVTGLSPTLVRQYLELYQSAKKDKLQRENLMLLIERNSNPEAIKKTIKHYSKPQAAMMGGLS